MAYITKSDIETYLNDNRLAQVSDRLNGVSDDDLNINQAILFAESLVNSYVSALGYKMPISCADGKPPEILRTLSIVCAVWKMYEGRATDEVRYRFEWANNMLKDFKSGKMGLVCQNGEMPLKPISEALGSYGYVAGQVNNLASYSDNVCNETRMRECKGKW
jgi:phage gp36-like protein